MLFEFPAFYGRLKNSALMKNAKRKKYTVEEIRDEINKFDTQMLFIFVSQIMLAFHTGQTMLKLGDLILDIPLPPHECLVFRGMSNLEKAWNIMRTDRQIYLATSQSLTGEQKIKYGLIRDKISNQILEVCSWCIYHMQVDL